MPGKISKIDKKTALRILLLVFIAAGFLFTRLFKLDTLPGGLHIDEAGALYDGWSLANFGVDRFRDAWPIYLQSKGDGQSIMLAYIAALLIKLFGGAYSVWFIRLPMTLFSALTLIFGMKLAGELFGKETFYPELTGLMIVFAPYFIMQSRFGLDCSLMLGASTVFLYFFTMGIKTDKTRYYVLSGISGGLMLYTYALSHIVLPLFLIIAAIYMIIIRRFRIKKWLIAGACLLPLAAPFIYFHIVNTFRLPQTKFLFFTITRIRFYRNYQISHPTWEYFARFFRNMFIGSNWVHEVVKGYTPLTYAAIPLCAIGFVSALIRIIISAKKKQASPFFPVVAWLISSCAFLSCIYTEVYRINFIYAALTLLMTNGIYTLISFFKAAPAKVCGITAAVLFSAVFFVQSGMFSKYYFTKYSKDYPCPLMFAHTIGEACDYVLNDEYLSSRTTYTSEMMIYHFLESGTSPYEYDINEYMQGKAKLKYCGVHPNDPPEDDCNYIISKDIYTLFQKRLVKEGFTAIEFPESFLFYK